MAQLRWIAARVLGAVITLFGVTVVVFIVLRKIPGNAITASLGIESGTLTPTQHAALAKLYGIDQPWYVQLGRWLAGCLHGDLGVSLTSGQPVTTLIWHAFPVTVELAALAAVIGTVVGVALGVFAGSRPGRIGDTLPQAGALVGLAIPEFVLGTAVVAGLAAAFGYFPSTGSFVPVTRSVSGNLSQILYPAVVLAVGFASNVMRTTRSEYVEKAQSDYVRTAHGKGVRPGRVQRTHILRNAAIPTVTLTGIQFGYLLGGTVIIEQIFALPGMGRLLFTAISDRDYPVVQGTVLVIAFLFVIINLVVDLLYQVIDPRTRITAEA